jgi:outer membrane cobalamin receptor
MRVKNDILSVLDATGVSTSSNAGRTRHRGVESALGAALLPTLRLDVAWSSATHRYEEWVIPVQGRNVSYAGRTMEQAPHTLGNALLTWSPRFLNGGRLAAEWSSTGTYYMDPENTHRYDGFDLWTLHGNVRLRGGELFARVTNVADVRYAELVSYNAFNREQYTPGNPRMVYAGMRWTWQR